ncbi:cell division protein FtsQ/DivIB [Entomomonas asaccharolytica]|uniref:Cell division protein FtsQ n=1 Tax=Entomomonas asaccharolytica TaxID=2785331 RepID=A0A974NEF3_9GAMM|nr:cell division protein FtsQ/DivIB [Entomomonas asaccharolytica]QQP84969.1 cell division protein FtsQ/DivIB [Entomomonas asaccharolytica]
MLTVRLRHGEPIAPWKQRANQRGASRPMPKKGVMTTLKSMADYLKIAGYVVVAIVFAIVTYNVTNKVMAYVNQPISKVSILGDLGYIDQQDLQRRIEPLVTTGFLNVDLEGLRNKLENTPWISHVEIERVWPNELKIELNGRQPIARWGEDSLLNNVGEPFVVKDIAVYQSLPLLAGPDYAHAQVMQQYQIISQLLRPMELGITSLTLTERGSWTLTTSTGLELVLGSGDVAEKIKRFSKAYEINLKAKMDNIARVDMRYSNGLAVAWKDPSKEIDTNNATKIVARQ